MPKANVLFIHGAGGGGWEWNIWSRIFMAHGFAVHAPDLLPSREGIAATSLQDYAEQVQQYLLHLSSPNILIGASMGGLLAGMNSARADVLVLINPMLPSPWHADMPDQTSYPEIIPWRSKANLASTRRALFDSDGITHLYAHRHWRDESGLVMNQAKAGVLIEYPRCPVVVMASEKDQDIPCELTEVFAKSMNATFIKLPDTSHVGPLLGRNAAQFALQTVGHLNGILAKL